MCFYVRCFFTAAICVGNIKPMLRIIGVGRVSYLLFVMIALKKNIFMNTKEELENQLRDLKHQANKIEHAIQNANMDDYFAKQQQMVGKYYKSSYLDSNHKEIDYYYVYEWSTSDYCILALQVVYTKYKYGWYTSIKTVLGVDLSDSHHPKIETVEISKEEFIKSYNDAQKHLSKLILI